MRLEWIGHACFSMTAADGTVVITDPYDDSVGIDMVPLKADLITMSHDHHDHCEMSMIVGKPVIARGPELAAVGSVTARVLDSYHDDAQGAKRGRNFIRIFEIDDLTVVHMGDQGCMPREDVIEAIAGADVLLLPVGGTYTVDAQGAKEIIETVKPQCVVPMHVKTRRCPYPIAPVTQFLSLMGMEDASAYDMIEITEDHVPQGVLLMKPRADEL